MTSYAPINQLPAPLAPQYPPLYPIVPIPIHNSSYQTGPAIPPTQLGSASSLVAANAGMSRTVFGGKKSRRNRRRVRKSTRRNRHTRFKH